MPKLQEDLDRLKKDIESEVGDLSGRVKTESKKLKTEMPRLMKETMSKSSTLSKTFVSSVKLPQGDVELIDALIDAGIFKKRDEGISFFAHKGIESSTDWLTKVRENLKEIKRLKAETKKAISP